MPRERRATYMDLLCIQWDKFRVPHDLNAVARALGLKPSVFIKEWNETYCHHFTETVDGFVHPRLIKQSEHYQLKAAKAARSSHARWNANASETHMRTHCEGNAIIADANAVEDAVVVKAKSLTPNSRTRDPLGADCPEFCEFYAMWPRRTQRKAAYAAYCKHVATAAKHAQLMAGTRKALAFGGELHGRPKDKIPYPATWLNGSDWYDDSGDLLQFPIATPRDEPVREEELVPLLPDASNIWQQALDAMQLDLDQDDFETWIQPLRMNGFRGDKAELSAPGPPHRNWVWSNYRSRIVAALQGKEIIMVTHEVEE